MATFTYKARNRQGEIYQEQMEATDRMTVASQLRQQGLLVIDVKEQGVGQKDILEPFKKVKLGDLVVFSRQFATMINAGLPIVRSLYVLAEQTENPKFKEVVTAVRKDGSEVSFVVKVMLLTPKEVEYFRHGGILHYVLRQLASRKAA